MALSMKEYKQYLLSQVITNNGFLLTVSGQFPPRKIAPRIIALRTITPYMIAPRIIAPRGKLPPFPNNCPLDDCSRIIAPEQLPHKDICLLTIPPWKLPPRKIAFLMICRLHNCSSDKWLRGKLPPKKIV